MILEAKHPAKCPWHKNKEKCDCGFFETVHYWRITPDGDKKVFVSVEDAINLQIEYAWNVFQYRYESQIEALQEFLDINKAVASRIVKN